MKTPSRLVPAIVAAGLFVLPGLSTSQAGYNPFRTDNYEDANRAGLFEVYFLGQYWKGDNSTFHDVTIEVTPPPFPELATGDLELVFDDASLWGLGMGYNLNSHFNVRGEFTIGNPDYTLYFGDYYGRGDAVVHTGKFNLDYNIIRAPFTPFVTGGVGYLFIDSRIPIGTELYWYYWDYYDVPTHSDVWFTANAAVGVRWDIGDSFFIKASVGKSWTRADERWLTAVEGMFAAGWKF